ncbi:MAG: CoA transferase, partial [Sciscionella sp.]
HDINFIALAGALQAIGPADAPPVVPLNLIGDYSAGGLMLAFGVACALYERSTSGKGQVLDVAMVDGIASMMAVFCQMLAQGSWSATRGEHWLDGSAHWYGCYETADHRYLTVGALEGPFYDQLLARLGLDPDEWPQWDRARWPALRGRLAGVFGSETLRHWQSELEGSDVCFAAAPSLSEAFVHPHLVARGTFVDHEGVMQPAPAPRFGRTPGVIGGSAPSWDADGPAMRRTRRRDRGSEDRDTDGRHVGDDDASSTVGLSASRDKPL